MASTLVWVFQASPGFRHRAPDLGVLPLRSGTSALDAILGSLQAFALTLGGNTFTDVLARLSVIGGQLAVIGELVPLIGNAIALVGDVFPPGQLVLAPPHSQLALLELSDAGFGFSGRVGTLPGDHAPHHNAAAVQTGVQMLLFQNPQLLAVGFHINLAPGAHVG
ncbi:hypothetical protein [Mycobacterium asiaticum]|uniref:Uncharacterized protein n=1 Tax=Mycobacterium asiaticum TaxID=1790 RepID=A0A1A3NTD5_MYCAS|nr:hypothetical protein [Mycobacterium asiaticum]OBK23582.1 hypothetical protein A5635_19145 [Mycobacterium asiaticum]OBK92899.1 hypothetical protein A5645_22110 [Mycobacterium asiaticum]